MERDHLGIILRSSGSSSRLPALDLNFAATKKLDSRVSFTRTSAAMQIGSTGALEYGPENLFLYSQKFDVANWTKGGASIVETSVVNPFNTTLCYKLVEASNNGNHEISQTVSSENNLVCFSIYVKAAGRTAVMLSMDDLVYGRWLAAFDLISGSVIVTANQGSWEIGDPFAVIEPVGNGWYRCALIARRGAGTSQQCKLRLWKENGEQANDDYQGDGTSGVYLWGAQLERHRIPRDYIPTTSAIVYGPRFTHDPITGQSLGLLIEESRTNYSTYSSVFSEVIWSKTAVNISSGGLLAPDGSVSLILRETAVTDTHRVFRGATSPSTTNSLSVFAKAAGRNWIYLASDDATGVRRHVWFNIATGTIGTIQAGWSNVKITAFPNGWYRCEGTITDNGGTVLFLIGMSNVDNSTSYLGDGTSGVYLWGSQLEAGSFATSYIPTTASVGQRAADLVTMTGTNFSSWHNANAGTLVCKFYPIANGGNHYVTWIGFNGNEFRAIRQPNNTQINVRVDGLSPNDILIDGSVPVANRLYSVGYSYDTHTGTIGASGGIYLAQTARLGEANPRATYMGISQFGSGTNANSNVISRITYWRNKFSERRLLELTAL